MPAVIIATTAAINVNIAAQNAARANQQHIARCSTELASYKPEKVSVQEMQENYKLKLVSRTAAIAENALREIGELE